MFFGFTNSPATFQTMMNDLFRDLIMEGSIIDGEEHLGLEAVLDSHLRRNRLEYLVKWKVYGYKHNSWVPKRDMASKDLIMKFHRDHLNAP